MGTKAMTSFRKRAALVVVAALSLASVSFASLPAIAQELAPEHIALARKYVDLTDKSSVYEIALLQAGVATMQQLITQNPEVSKQLDAAITKTLDEYKAKKGELLDQFARVYALRLSMEELQQIVAFYESPAGSKLAQVNSEANQDLQRVMQVFQNNLQIEFMSKVRADLKAQGINL
ncbi:DUF2059 domain-containing protein [Paradevosia shaoguanensis]|uniref:DUF2059 domain-containing protein n=1 Tax=Paradevosia shaoguanensis TaxID=1335043 RepID=A0AA41QMM7_9HYPH|nr:DUF2059 domain-containing protein [Paradevosia shaoguanensis]KFL28201.1 hypothetical protein JP74_03075 [Devosia sp. 17-2-E-8]MCF1741808.1 DUF2059 domain-containing protein [Paradevosia shaoguanensis]MCI0126291.1 DUF2059 domain-containing protein [Paradevosia shaoguanensis]CDP50063.1 hypothetical protein [Devosia sp. DBB001]